MSFVGLFLFASVAVAQKEDTKDVAVSSTEQKFNFPAKPKDKWEIGVHGGSAFLLNTPSKNAWILNSGAVGIDARKSLGYVLSLRFGYTYFHMNGGQGSSGRYKTHGHEVHLEAIANLGNILFHKENSRWGLYGLAGLGGIFAQATVDPDGDGKFVNAFTNKTKNYVGNGHKLSPAVSLGAGISFRPAKFMSISIEERVLGLAPRDFLDGTQRGRFSAIPYTQLRLGFFVGGKDKSMPLYWVNPVAYSVKQLGDAASKKVLDDIAQDDDGDGVPNFLDKEPNTKKGYPVDVRGVALDSDKDGIVDGEDKEPYSPPGYPIDQFGVAQVPPPACCQDLKKGGRVADAKGDLPSIYFDKDKYYLDPASESVLFGVAERLQANPDAKLLITGYDASTNDRKYNEQLAYNRAIETRDYLINKYGISRDRFIIKYVGEKANPRATAVEKKKSSRADLRFAADGEQGDSNPPAPHPGLKAGSNK